jgi:hypothetical protein
MNPLYQRLEAALLRRNPPLTESLRPGLPVAKIRKDLKSADIEGVIEPLVELYSWRDGTVLQGSSDAIKAGLRAGFAPPVVSLPSESYKAELQRICAMAGKPFDPNVKICTSFHFLPLKKAIVDMRSYKDYAQHQPKLSVLVGRYFPILWNGSTFYIALDIDPSGHNRVVAIEKRDDKPLREAYDSFEDFLKDLISANENNEHLSCIQAPKKHIESLGVASTPNAGANKKQIPVTKSTLALRTDFSNEASWKSLCASVQDPDNEFGPNLDFVSDQQFDGLTADQLPSHLSEDSTLTFAFIIDHLALSHPDHPILVIDLHDQKGRTFRVIPSEIGIVENNLSIANMDFDEFATAVDKEGVFRGFPGQ